MTHVEGTAAGDLDVKRCYLPGVVIRSQCPKCGAPFADDLSDRYISYPKMGEAFEYGCYCEVEECEFEWKVTLRLDVTLSVVSPEVQP